MNAPLAALGAPLRVVAGAELGRGLFNPRTDLLPALVAAVPAAELPRTLALVFNLCGHAHTLAATLALRAARIAVPDAPVDLDGETRTEHARRLQLDWPLHLGARPMAGAALTPEAALGLPAAEWLAQWEQRPGAWLARWAQRRRGWLAPLMATALALRQPLPADVPTLNLHHDADALATFAAQVLQTPALVLRPTWQGRCAHTGCWSRAGLHGPLDTALLLGCRIAEWLRLGSGQAQLVHGALALGSGRAVAWVEMARGLLLHVAEADGDGGLRRYRVVAPTEWNFHPEGAVARMLHAVGSHPAAVAATMAAFDPCVPYVIEAGHA
ncbi:MAG: hydrogenase formation protein [Proteobacteria bacterium]|nr:hydrogenase formation protein [Pseudomonadota bacterium]